jgi:hypothetical protein
MQAQWALQAQCEANPQDWMLSGVAPKLRKVRRRVAEYVNCEHQDLVRVPPAAALCRCPVHVLFDVRHQLPRVMRFPLTKSRSTVRPVHHLTAPPCARRRCWWRTARPLPMLCCARCPCPPVRATALSNPPSAHLTTPSATLAWMRVSAGAPTALRQLARSAARTTMTSPALPKRTQRSVTQCSFRRLLFATLATPLYLLGTATQL